MLKANPRKPIFDKPNALSPHQDTDDVGFGVYVHFPFCQHKCPYCDFNSHVRIKGWDEEALTRAYLSELDHIAQVTGPRTVKSIFFGGGTPSLMQPKTVELVINAISTRWSLANNAEITLEANPGSVEASRFSGYKSAGVNRASIGIQALNDNDLRALGRIHTVAEAWAALQLAASVFERFSFDLIYARPHQTIESWHRELNQALSLSAGHLSLYQLTIEPNTLFQKQYAAGKITIPDPETALHFYETTQDVMETANMPAYEISNHAAKGMESQHNLIYWRYGDYAGIGPGAHGRITSNGNRLATTTEKQPDNWLKLVQSQNHGFTERATLTNNEIADELLLMGLRLREGVDLSRLAKLGHVRPSERIIDELTSAGLITLHENGTHLSATKRGRFILNEVVYRLSASFEFIERPTNHANDFNPA